MEFGGHLMVRIRIADLMKAFTDRIFAEMEAKWRQQGANKHSTIYACWVGFWISPTLFEAWWVVCLWVGDSQLVAALRWWRRCCHLAPPPICCQQSRDQLSVAEPQCFDVGPMELYREESRNPDTRNAEFL